MLRRWMKDYAVPASQLAIKFLTALRTGVDTFLLSSEPSFALRLLNVILLDGVFMTFWFIAAYAGASEWARRVKPFAVIGACVMYAFMFVVGFQVHHDFLAIGVRLAGGVALAVDVWDYIGETVQDMRKAWASRPLPDTEDYARRILHNGLRRAYSGAGRKLQDHLNVLAFEGLRAELPRLMSGSLQTVVEVPKSSANVRDRSAEVQWLAMKDRIPTAEFTRTTVEEVAGCGKTMAVRIINAAVELGDVQRVRHGIYVLVREGTLVVSEE